MKKKWLLSLVISVAYFLFAEANAQSVYTVKKGDSLWKIAVKFQQGLDEIILENPQFSNPNLIYPGDTVYIPSPSNTLSLEEEVIRLVNEERKKIGLAPVTNHWEVSRVARIKSQDMIDGNYFAHNSPTYGTPFQMLKSFGITYRSAGENIAKGQSSPRAVMNAWMNSAGHKANILSANYTKIGVGLAISNNGTYYWTQLFIQS